MIVSTAHRPDFRPFHLFYAVHIPELLRIVNINVPVVEVDRLILIHPQQIGALSLLHHFPLIVLVIDAGKHPLFIQSDPVKRRLQSIQAVQNKRRFCCRLWRLCRLPLQERPKCLIPLGCSTHY